MATGSYLTQNHSRSQSEIQGDLHNYMKHRIFRNVIDVDIGAIDLDFLFMADNAHSHKTWDVSDIQECENTERIKWLAYSPDLSPMEYASEAFRRYVSLRNYSL
ncbi:hypothetical protein TNCV_2685711 [Trichonephila clavipes]|nr:hypothetical protein TNCV_2685711 [Trichonephila clavipes]